MALVSLGFANCELRKALIYKGLWCADKTPKAALDSTPFGIYVDIAAHCLARPSVRPKERFLCACVCPLRRLNRRGVCRAWGVTCALVMHDWRHRFEIRATAGTSASCAALPNTHKCCPVLR